MNVVIDTSALIAVIANEPKKRKLIKATRGVHLIAPQSVHWEIGNAFSSMLRQKRRIAMDDVRRALSAYRSIPLRFVDVELEEALDVAQRLGLYAYDAYVLVCARRSRCPILTLDDHLAEAGRLSGLDVLEV